MPQNVKSVTINLFSHECNEKPTFGDQVISDYSSPIGFIAVIQATDHGIDVVDPQAVFAWLRTDHREPFLDIPRAHNGSIDIEITVHVLPCGILCPLHS